ncbi:hypothetical protein ACMFMG_001285 [Clarireedia jacksonii]
MNTGGKLQESFSRMATELSMILILRPKKRTDAAVSFACSSVPAKESQHETDMESLRSFCGFAEGKFSFPKLYAISVDFWPCTSTTTTQPTHVSFKKLPLKISFPGCVISGDATYPQLSYRVAKKPNSHICFPLHAHLALNFLDVSAILHNILLSMTIFPLSVWSGASSATTIFTPIQYEGLLSCSFAVARSTNLFPFFGGCFKIIPLLSRPRHS